MSDEVTFGNHRSRVPCTDMTDERRRWDAALLRKSLRKELAERFRQVRETAGG